MELWVVITIAAAFAQNLRSAWQKALKGRLSTAGAAYARFVYAAPLAVLYLLGLKAVTGNAFPTVTPAFAAWLIAGSVAQILFTVTLLALFSLKSFAVGTTFSKLDILLIALFGALFLGDNVSPLSFAFMGLGVVGTILLSAMPGPGGFSLRGVFGPATGLGLLCAALLGLSFVFFRGALLTLDGTPYLMAAAFSLALNLVLQSFIMGVWFALRAPSDLTAVFREWRRAAPVGFFGVLGSIGWFTAFTLQNAAYVSAVGKIELVFAWLSSLLFFREKMRPTETIGIALVFISVVGIALR